MPTLTPKAAPMALKPFLDTSVFSFELPNLSIDGGTGTSGEDRSSAHASDPNSKDRMDRLEYLDSLRGILAVIVVFHHFRCGFRPCHMFGSSAEWLSDPEVCKDVHTNWNIMLNPFFNGTFCVSVFLVMSGVVLAHGLWKAPAEKWRVAVAKRYIRLAIPCAAALLFAFALAGFTVHEDAAQITGSLWLKKMPMERPSPVTGLLGQIGWGVWHGTSTLNNALWTMKYELFGSYLVFLLVALLKGSPHRVRSRWLGALFVLMLVPSSTRNYGLEARVSYNVIQSVPVKPGQKQKSTITQRVVAVDPVKHSHLLHEIHEQVNTGNNKEISLLALTYMEAPPDAWYLKKDKIDAHVIVLDKPKKKHNLSNAQIYRELQGAADPSNKNYGTPEIQMIKVTGWKTVNPWLWYATFIAGAWISEGRLSAASGIQVGRAGFRVAGTPLVHGFAVLAFLSASYPFSAVEASEYARWRFMQTIASSLGLSSVAHFFWSIVGAVSLVYYIVVHSEFLRRLLVSHPLLPKLGQMSFALYLTHIPILYTLTCALFVQMYPFFDDNLAVASLVALLVSLPVMFLVAFLFWKYVDQPAISLSRQIGQRLLGISETHPDRGHSSSKAPGGAEAATTAETRSC